MNTPTPGRGAIFKRFATSLAAIMAVTSIIGIKAMDWERRAEIAQAEREKPPATLAHADLKPRS